jgi:exodeoxyribonuclease V alpha subunit
MSAFPEHLHIHVEEGFVEERDLRSAAVFVDLATRTLDGARLASARLTITDNVWLATARTLAAYRDQHTCVDLAEFPGWEEDLRNCTALVAEPHTVDPTRRQPFILDLGRLYIHRSWEEECFVAEKLRTRPTDKLQVITGGPGTGKTTTVAKQLVERLSATLDRPVLVGLAAPTGKAAKRMTEAMDGALAKANAPQQVRDIVLASPATTIHSLLGANPNRVDNRFTHHAGNKLKHDIVIVDETSMLSLSMMYHLISALDDETEFILVGDPDQLASVEAGTVLADIVAGSPTDRITFLTTQHRFKDAKNIVAAAAAIRKGEADAAFQAITDNDANVRWIDPIDAPDLAAEVLESVVDHANRVAEVARNGKPAEALALKNEMQVLCAHRNGKMGVAGWNRVIEERMGFPASGQWYVGRPIIVTENDRTTGLFNGDIGVISANESHRVASFSTDAAKPAIPVTRLPNVETVHALTIHKSQGSEYDHVIVVLPDRASRILTRELLYTGVTRAKTKLTIIGTAEAFRSAIATPIRRATGLAARLRLFESA